MKPGQAFQALPRPERLARRRSLRGACSIAQRSRKSRAAGWSSRLGHLLRAIVTHREPAAVGFRGEIKKLGARSLPARFWR